MDTRKGDWIQTYTLRQFWPLDPRPEDVTIEDVAHALSMICRFTGHVRDFYSVAQHSVLVSLRAAALATNSDEAISNARWGLLHDASEAYLVDVARPVKRLPEMTAYRDAEKAVQRAVCERFGLPDTEPPAVKTADSELRYTEARDLFSGVHPEWHWYANPLPDRIEPLAPADAKRRFLSAFHALFPLENPPA